MIAITIDEKAPGFSVDNTANLIEEIQTTIHEAADEITDLGHPVRPVYGPVGVVGKVEIS